MNFDESQTKTNLARAFAGECQAGARYQFIGQKAIKEGKKNIQMLMKDLAKNEMAHARVFWDLISSHGGTPDTNIEIKAGYPFQDGNIMDMIKTSANNEKSENTSIYPTFSKIAEDEGFKDIAEKFKLVALVENDHFMILDSLYNKLKSKAIYKSAVPLEWKCGHCGHTDTGKQAYNNCPLCDLSNDYIDLSFVNSAKK